MTVLDDARAALAVIASRHPTGSIAVGSQTHGGPIQYSPGCVAHGAWCSEWSITAKAVGSLRALVAEHERLTAPKPEYQWPHRILNAGEVAPPTDDEREALEILAQSLYANTGREARDFPWASRDEVTREHYRENARRTIARMGAAGFRRQGPITDAQTFIDAIEAEQKRIAATPENEKVWHGDEARAWSYGMSNAVRIIRQSTES